MPGCDVRDICTPCVGRIVFSRGRWGLVCRFKSACFNSDTIQRCSCRDKATCGPLDQQITLRITQSETHCVPPGSELKINKNVEYNCSYSGRRQRLSVNEFFCFIYVRFTLIKVYMRVRVYTCMYVWST